MRKGALSPTTLAGDSTLSYFTLLPCVLASVCLLIQGKSAAGQPDESLRAVIPRTKQTPAIDGNLDEYDDAFCTPIEYFHADLRNRPAQFYYLWDEQAIYVAVRTLDEKPFVPDNFFWVGDAVEWYLDTRPTEISERLSWGPGAVHCFFSAVSGDQVKPRFSLRPGYEDAIPAVGIQLAANRTEFGLEYEFKLPWSNFPDFEPAADRTLHLDAELSYSDGVSRSFRSFVFGGPLSVEQPANLARVALVDQFQRKHWKHCGPVMMPIRVDVPWEQQDDPQVRATMAMPPNRMEDVGHVVFQLLATDGHLIGEYFADKQEVFQPSGNFVRRTAHWPISAAAPASYHVQAIVYGRDGRELTRVAPRLVSVNMEQGY